MILDPAQVAAALPGYDIGTEIGRGGFGVVLEARHRRLFRDVAIKQLPPSFGADPVIRARFLSEARMLASLDHPHIVPVYDFVEHDGLCLLVMEKVTGGTVWDRFQTDGITMENACAVALATCAALYYAHERGVLHRDVKPENLLLSSTWTLKVSDFGIATVLGGGGALVTRAGDILGTPAYMAPEQAQGAGPSPAVDLYAVGVMLYELLSGELPYPDEEPLAVLYRHVNEPARPLLMSAPNVPEGIAEVVMRSLERAPNDRYGSAQTFGAAIVRATNRAWGAGWLTRCEVPVFGADSMLQIADDQPASVAPTLPAVSPNQRVIRPATGTHIRGPTLVGAQQVELLPPEEAIGVMRGSANGSPPPAAPTAGPGPLAQPTYRSDTTVPPIRPIPPAPLWWRKRATVSLFTVLALVASAVAVFGLRSVGGHKKLAAAKVAIAPSPVAAGLAWRGMTQPAVPRQQAASLLDSGTIWILGGLSGNASTVKVEGYDPAIDTWKSGPDLPVPVHHAMAAQFRGQIIVLGGWIPVGRNLTGVASDRVFGLRGGTWVELPKLNRPRAAGAAVVAGDRLIAVGGQANGQLVSTGEEFDGTRWTDVADIPTPRDHLAAASDGRMLYAVGGRTRSADKNLAVLERFDPVAGQWQRLPDMPTARGGLGAAISGRLLVAVGGEGPTNVFGAVEAFDLDRGVWNSLPAMPAPRQGMNVVGLGSSIYAIDGSIRPTHAEGSTISEVLDLA